MKVFEVLSLVQLHPASDGTWSYTVFARTGGVLFSNRGLPHIAAAVSQVVEETSARHPQCEWRDVPFGGEEPDRPALSRRAAGGRGKPSRVGDPNQKRRSQTVKTDIPKIGQMG